MRVLALSAILEDFLFQQCLPQEDERKNFPTRSPVRELSNNRIPDKLVANNATVLPTQTGATVFVETDIG